MHREREGFSIMIMPVCMRPKEDELLYGWLSRLSLENGYTSLADFGKRFLTERTVLQPLEKISWYPRVDFIRDLDRTCEEYKEISFFPTADELLRKMTPLYAVFPFLTYGNQSWWTQFILREPGTALTGTGNRGNMIPEFLSCPECRKQDRKKYGFSYLRTWHHLPGVRVCAVHRVPLQTLAYRKQKVLDPDEDGIILSEKELVGNLETEWKISQFAKEMYERPLFFDLRGLQALLLERMEELGIRKKIKEEMETAEFLPYLNGECEKRVQKMLMEPRNGMDEIMAFSAFLFGEYSVLEEKAKRYIGELEEPFADVVRGRFQLLSGFGRLVHLKCETCGKEFWIHPYALGLGCGCPSCEAAMTLKQRINRRLSFFGDGNYELAQDVNEENMGERVDVIHKTCGSVRKTRLMETLWMQKKCDCETRVSFADAAERVRAASPNFTLIQYIGGKKNHIVRLKHKVCGQTFEWELGRFQKRPTCMVCERRRVPRGFVEDFLKRMRDLVGDEYELVSGFTDMRSRILVRHQACGTVTEMIPNDLLRGRRCNLCHKAIRRGELEAALESCTGGYYRITGMKNVRYCIEGENGEKFFRDPGCIMQELSRPTESPLFTHRIAKPKPAPRKEALIYLSAKEICRRKGFWSPRDSADILPLKQVQDLMRWLVKNDYLERIGYGKYVLSERKISGDRYDEN